MEKEELRKGPWTEQEDGQLMLYVNLFGDRRWDFIAKVSGLRRSGKSCRLRWVNYLQPGLRRGKMTPHEERLVLELHNKWGNRWSKIAQKLPGRTDNEIKNYWKTHMRKKAQEWKRGTSPSMSSSSAKEINPMPTPVFTALPDQSKEHKFYDTGGVDVEASPQANKTSLELAGDSADGYSMDEIWKDIEFSEEDGIKSCTSHFMALPQGDLFPIGSLPWSMTTNELHSFPFELQDDLIMKSMH